MSYQDHGWRHRPRSEGGTDPIPVAASGLPVAIANEGLVSRSLPGGITFHTIAWNDDDVFGYAVVSGTAPNKVAKFVTVTPGTYMVDYLAFWSGDFGAGDTPFIQPTVYLPSVASEDVMANTLDARSFDDTQGIIFGEQFTAAEKDHHTLVATQIFTFDEAGWGETSIGIGVKLAGMVSQTKTCGGALSIVRLGDATAEQVIA